METFDNTLNKISEKYYDEIFRFCVRRIQNQDEAYDITQDVFLALITSYSNINPENVRKWLYETAKNKIADYFRKKKKERDHKTDLQNSGTEESDEPSYSLYDAMSGVQIEQLRQKILSELSEEELELYKDFFIRDLNYDELAAKYNVKKDAMYKRISRLKRIMEGIKEKYF